MSFACVCHIFALFGKDMAKHIIEEGQIYKPKKNHENNTKKIPFPISRERRI